MNMARWCYGAVCGVAGVLLLTGCGANPKDLQIQSLNERLRDCQNENEGLRSQLAVANSERDAARQRLAGLEQENRDLRAALAQADRAPENPSDEWQGSGAVRWVNLGADFLFDSGRASLRPAARAKLQEVVARIRQDFAGREIWVIGHTDNDPILKTKNLWVDNLDLSLNRAATVYRELMQLGLDAKSMVAGGQGEYNPLSPNDTNSNKQKNRRVQIFAIDASGTLGN